MTTRKPQGRAPGEEAAAAAAEAAAQEMADNATVSTYQLSTGVVLRLKPVSGRVLSDAARRVPRPEVPIWHNKDRGRDEPNPDDPAYKEAMAQWSRDSMDASLKVALIIGTSIESIPEGMVPPESDQWIEELQAAYEVVGGESPVRTEPEKARYLDWLLYYAMGRDEDSFILTRALFSSTLITREELAAAIASFRNLTVRYADTGSPGDAGSS